MGVVEMERELLLTGVGGQGVQLAAQVIGRAAALEGRNTMVFGLYSGMMRGGNSDSTVVVADGPIEAPPIVSHSWSAIVMHHKFWAPMVTKLRPGAVVLLNSSLFEGDLDREALEVFDVPATDVAAEMGNPMGATMVMVGAYAGVTGLVGVDAAVEGMRQSLPPYRQQHAATNESAIRAGAEAVEPLAAPAWEAASSTGASS
ncbi:MAG TPA: 2-oxoacid:acceptor oxidoreductase family protein [Acidimicrobiales bacterium]|nr:2-oxoacid:acceptor oxidoreductase family protein [Acidimicrobiales bacterium]